ncbi:hypothetical protein IWW55_005523 [Coemansia sp. RSA 2706]|nr:hypothetical protein IWW55_005523 [Coemansia sp. RSA 2706]
MTHYMDRLRNRLAAGADRIRQLGGAAPARTGAALAMRVLLVGAAVVAAVVSSAALYGLFYRLYVPQLMHQAPVHLQYAANGTAAEVSFVAAAHYKFLSTSQAYTVALDLHVPASETNRALGVFMVELELRDRRGRAVHRSARAAMLPYRSAGVRALQTLVRAVPLALGLADESTWLHVPLLERAFDRHFTPITHAHVALSKPVQTYAASVTIRAQFSGLRYWMYYWRLPTALVFVAAAVAWQLVLAAVAWSVLESYARARAAPAAPRADGQHAGLLALGGQRGSGLESSGLDSPEPKTPSLPGSPLVRALSFLDRQSAPSDSEADEQSVPDGSSQPQSLRRRASGRRADDN